MKKTLKLLWCFILLFLMTVNVEAKTIEHFHAAADENVNMDDEVNGSVALAGADTSMKGKADGASFMAGNKVNFNGESEYIALAGNSVNIKGTVNNDAFVAGNIITVDEKANLKRDAVLAGADIEISGNVGRNISIYGGSVTLSGAKIEGNVKIYASSIKVDEASEIKGNLSYPEDAEANISKGAIQGKIIKTDAMQADDDAFVTTLMGKFWSFLALMLVFAVLSLAMPKVFDRMQENYDKLDFNKGLEVFTKGIVFLVLVPIIVLILILMSIGIPMALILLALYFIFMYLSTIFTGYLVGYKLWQKFFNKDINMLVVGIFGLAVLFILSLIPGVSYIVSTISMVMGIGIIYDVVLKKLGSNE